ncbi:MAG: tannase/feruloyl esterase family alpha/beta hydrolase [Gemmatimonadota bacterium]|nr:MAG: tannase/feruloyl esterase family alpha/beta hydrolase [Gemmatimonadota bacterium]
MRYRIPLVLKEDLSYSMATPVKILIGITFLASFPTAVMAQRSFSEAASSAVNYSHAGARKQKNCHELQKFTDANLTILATESAPPNGDVPAYCRVSGMIAPEIEFRVSLPDDWNRRVYMTGNGGHAGEDLDAPYLVARHENALRHGFVTAATNTGHSAAKEPEATFAFNNDQKLVDYAFRAVHLTAVTAKQMAAAYYDQPVAFSYWDGCSTGGRQGLMEAQRFPADFDGILAGAPVLDFTGTTVMGLWYGRVQDEIPIPVEIMDIVSHAVTGKCDAIDGLEDGLIEDPRNCDFDPLHDLPICTAEQAEVDCITRPQAEALQKMYSGPMTSGGENIFPGMPLGAEKVARGFGGALYSGWAGTVLNVGEREAFAIAIAKSSMRYMAFPQDQPDWEASTFNFDEDPQKLTALGDLVDAVDPELSDFAARGGKLLMYFGWADPLLMPQMGVDYYEAALEANGPDTTDFFRLFMMPGVFHCAGGYGPDRFDGMTPLIEWVENGTPPEALRASRVEDGEVIRSRPLCSYPQVARYRGAGDVDDASNFTCRTPPR